MLPWTLFQGKKEKMLILSVISNRYHCRDFFSPPIQRPMTFPSLWSRVIFYIVLFSHVAEKLIHRKFFISLLFSIQNWCFQISTQQPEKALKCYRNKDINTIIKGRGEDILGLLNVLSSFVSEINGHPFYT